MCLLLVKKKLLNVQSEVMELVQSEKFAYKAQTLVKRAKVEV